MSNCSRSQHAGKAHVIRVKLWLTDQSRRQLHTRPQPGRSYNRPVSNSGNTRRNNYIRCGTQQQRSSCRSCSGARCASCCKMVQLLQLPWRQHAAAELLQLLQWMQLQQLLFAAASDSAAFFNQLNRAQNLYRSNPQPQPLHHKTQRMQLVTPTTHWFHTSAGYYRNDINRSHCRGQRSYHRARGGSSYISYRSYPSYINYVGGSNYISPAAATPPIHQRCSITSTALQQLDRSSIPARCSVLLQTAAAAGNDACSCRAAAVAAAAADAAAPAAAAAASTAQLHTSCGMAAVRQQLCHISTAVLQPVGRGCAAALQQLCSGRASAAAMPLRGRRYAAALHMFCSSFATAPPQLVQLLRRSATTALQKHGADSSAAAPRLQRQWQPQQRQQLPLQQQLHPPPQLSQLTPRCCPASVRPRLHQLLQLSHRQHRRRRPQPHRQSASQQLQLRELLHMLPLAQLRTWHKLPQRMQLLQRPDKLQRLQLMRLRQLPQPPQLLQLLPLHRRPSCASCSSCPAAAAAVELRHSCGRAAA